MRTFSRRIFALALPVFAGALLLGCEETPQQPTQPDQQQTLENQEVAANHGGGSKGSRHGTFTRPAWGNGHLWEFKSPKQWGDDLLDPNNPSGKRVFGSPSNENAHSPFYIIGPDAGDDGVQSEAFLGPHDHVFPVPEDDPVTFNPNWHIHLVFPAPGGNVATSGPLGLAHAADTDGNGTLEQLTSYQAVLDAEDEGNVILLSTPEVFVCPVHDIPG